MEVVDHQERTQKFVNVQLSGLVKDQLKPMRDKVVEMMQLSRSNRGKVERMHEELEKDFKEVVALLGFNTRNSLFAEKNTKDRNSKEELAKSKRNSFEELSRYFLKTKEFFEVFKVYSLSTLDLFQVLRNFEHKSSANIKQSFVLFVEKVGVVIPQQGSNFPTTKYLTEALDPNALTDFEFDIGSFLLPVESELVLKASSSTQNTVDFDLLKTTFEGLKQPDWHPIIHKLVADKFLCLLLDLPILLGILM